MARSATFGHGRQLNTEREKNMIYAFRKGFTHKVDPNVAGEVCEGLRNQGKLTAEELVNVSRPEDAPLHGEFEWNDTVAGENWRKHQARCLIGSLIVVTPETNKEVRKYHITTTDSRRYESYEVIMQSVEGRDLLLREAMRELSAFKKKYAHLSELAKVFDAIDGLENAV